MCAFTLSIIHTLIMIICVSIEIAIIYWKWNFVKSLSTATRKNQKKKLVVHDIQLHLKRRAQHCTIVQKCNDLKADRFIYAHIRASVSSFNMLQLQFQPHNCMPLFWFGYLTRRTLTHLLGRSLSLSLACSFPLSRTRKLACNSNSRNCSLSLISSALLHFQNEMGSCGRVYVCVCAKCI